MTIRRIASHALASLALAVTFAGVASAQNADPKADESRDSKLADGAEVAAAGVYVQDLLEAVPPSGTAITKLDVDNRLGDVRIVGHDGSGLSIFAVKHAPDAATLERLEVKLVQDPSGPVSIRTQLATGRDGSAIAAGSVRIDLVVRVPRSAKVAASVWNGKLRVKGVENGASAQANEGPIDIEQVSGDVSADSAAGSQRFKKIYGTLEAQTLEGDVDVDSLRGERLAASVKTGSVSARSVIVREMVIRVVKGDIRVEAEVIAGGSYKITSISGNVEARLRGKARAKLIASAKRGKLALPERLRPTKTANDEVVGYLGSGGSPAHVEVRSKTGDVVVAKF